MADSSLLAIRNKIRRLTRSLSPAQLTDADIDEYVNTFIQYDFPEHLRTFTLRQTFTFFTSPYIDTYQTSAVPGDQFFEWKEIYTTIHEPIYIAGQRAFFSQDRDQFFSIFPMINQRNQVGTGNGVNNVFGTLANPLILPAFPVLRNQVLIDSIGVDGQTGMQVHDDGAGNLIGDGAGTINYVTGAFNVTFNNPPGVSQPVNAQIVPYQASQPTSLLFYNSQITVRPVPDQSYRVNMEVYIRPTELLAANQSPDLQEWWQYIAYGAAKKVFEDRMDMQSIQMILPEYKAQESLVLRRTIVQQTGSRTATIYTEQTSLGSQSGIAGFGGGTF